MLLAGAIAMGVGLLWSLCFPINKALWTSSYVLFTAGAALVLLAICYWAVEIRGIRKPFEPLVVFGVNPIATFVGSSFLIKMLAYINPSPWRWIYQHAFRWMGERPGSLAMALAYVLLWLGIAALLYRKRIFIKV
jgi:predicted acyltransferase